MRRLKRSDAAHRVAGKVELRYASFHRAHRGVVLANVPVFVVADAEEDFGTQRLLRIEHVAVRAIGDVVAMLFEPVGERKLPSEELARTDGQWIVEDLRDTSRRGGRS